MYNIIIFFSGVNAKMLMQNFGQIACHWNVKHWLLSFLYGMCVSIYMCVFVCLRVKKSISWLCLAFAQPRQAEGLDSFTFIHVFISDSLKFLFLLDAVFVLKIGWLSSFELFSHFLFKMPCGCFHQTLNVYVPTPCWKSLSGGPSETLAESPLPSATWPVSLQQYSRNVLGLHIYTM